MKTRFYIALFLLLPFISKSQITPEDIVNRVKKQVTCPWADQTVDTFKAGDPQTELTGIAVCMFADMQVLAEAVDLGCNFIITHEPVFYNHLDQTENFSDDPVFLEKKEFIEKNGLVIFLGHIKSEEAGMEYCAEWLREFVAEVPVHFIENKPNFLTY